MPFIIDFELAEALAKVERLGKAVSAIGTAATQVSIALDKAGAAAKSSAGTGEASANKQKDAVKDLHEEIAVLSGQRGKDAKASMEQEVVARQQLALMKKHVTTTKEYTENLRAKAAEQAKAAGQKLNDDGFRQQQIKQLQDERKAAEELRKKILELRAAKKALSSATDLGGLDPAQIAKASALISHLKDKVATLTAAIDGKVTTSSIVSELSREAATASKKADQLTTSLHSVSKASAKAAEAGNLLNATGERDQQLKKIESRRRAYELIRAEILKLRDAQKTLSGAASLPGLDASQTAKASSAVQTLLDQVNKLRAAVSAKVSNASVVKELAEASGKASAGALQLATNLKKVSNESVKAAEAGKLLNAAGERDQQLKALERRRRAYEVLRGEVKKLRDAQSTLSGAASLPGLDSTQTGRASAAVQRLLDQVAKLRAAVSAKVSDASVIKELATFSSKASAEAVQLATNLKRVSSESVKAAEAGKLLNATGERDQQIRQRREEAKATEFLRKRINQLRDAQVALLARQSELGASLNSDQITQATNKIARLKDQILKLRAAQAAKLTNSAILGDLAAVSDKTISDTNQFTRALKAEKVEALKAKAALVGLKGATKSLGVQTEAAAHHLNYAAQSAAGFRAALAGIGSSMGIYTGKTILTATAVYALARGFKDSLATGIAFQDQMVRSNAIMGNSAEQSAMMTTHIRELGKSTVFTATEVSEGLEALAMAGLSASEAAVGIYPALQLANIGNIDMYKSADILTNVMTGFGMTAKEIPKIVDDLATAVVSSNATIQQMGMSLAYVAPIASAVGASMEEVVAILEVFHNAGIKGSRAGTSLRRAYANLLKPSKDGRAAIADLGLTITDTNGDMLEMSAIMQQMADKGAGASDIIKIFGVRAAPAMQTLLRDIKHVGSEFAIFRANLEDNDGAARNLETTFKDTLGKDLKILMSAVQEQQLKLFDNLNGSLREVVQNVTAWVTALKPETIANFAETLKTLGNTVLFLGKVAIAAVAVKAIKVLTSALMSASSQAMTYYGAVQAVTAGQIKYTSAGYASTAMMTGQSAATAKQIVALNGLRVAFRTMLGPIGLVYAALEGLPWLYDKITGKSKEAAAATKTLTEAQRVEAIAAQEQADESKRKLEALAKYIESGGKAGNDAFTKKSNDSLTDYNELIAKTAKDIEALKKDMAKPFRNSLTSEEMIKQQEEYVKNLAEYEKEVKAIMRLRTLSSNNQFVSVPKFPEKPKSPLAKEDYAISPTKAIADESLKILEEQMDSLRTEKAKIEADLKNYKSSGGVTPDGFRKQEEFIKDYEKYRAEQAKTTSDKIVEDFVNAQKRAKNASLNPTEAMAQIEAEGAKALAALQSEYARVNKKALEAFEKNRPKFAGDANSNMDKAREAQKELMEADKKQAELVEKVRKKMEDARTTFASFITDQQKLRTTTAEYIAELNKKAMTLKALDEIEESSEQKTLRTSIAQIKLNLATAQARKLSEEYVVSLRSELAAQEKSLEVVKKLDRAEKFKSEGEEYLKRLRDQVADQQKLTKTRDKAAESNLKLLLTEQMLAKQAAEARGDRGAVSLLDGKIKVNQQLLRAIKEEQGKVLPEGIKEFIAKYQKGRGALGSITNFLFGDASRDAEYADKLEALSSVEDSYRGSELAKTADFLAAKKALEEEYFKDKYSKIYSFSDQTASLLTNEMQLVRDGEKTWKEAGRDIEKTIKDKLINSLTEYALKSLQTFAINKVVGLFDKTGKDKDKEVKEYGKMAAEKSAIDIAAATATAAAITGILTPTLMALNAVAQPAALSVSLATSGSNSISAITGIEATAAALQLAGTNVAGAREHGGPVSANRTYLVGERGQELFTPKVDGTITSNADLKRHMNKPDAAPVVNETHYHTTNNINAIDTQSFQDALAKNSKFLNMLGQNEDRRMGVTRR